MRRRLAAHFVQRRRADIRAYLDERTTFPDRLSTEATYQLGPEYRRLFDQVHAYATDLVRSAEGCRASSSACRGGRRSPFSGA